MPAITFDLLTVNFFYFLLGVLVSSYTSGWKLNEKNR